MTRTRWFFSLILGLVMVAMLSPVSAGGTDGRPDGAAADVPAEEPVGDEPDVFSGWDGDGPAPRVLHAGNVTIDGSQCVGNDCNTDPPSPGYGFHTIRLQENNLRIMARDTSGGAFPTRDWQIEFNSSSSGGASYFKVRDCGNTGSNGSTCGGTSQFTIEAGADNDSIYVDSAGNQGGNVGFGTTTPVVDLHALSGNTPTLRLAQDGSSGFTAQSWDLAGNESGFFVRDVTNGSALPFRIEPSTASSTLYLDNAERIGVNTTAPDASLHIRETGADRARLRFEDTGAGTPSEWELGPANNGRLAISEVSAAGNQLTIDSSGNAYFQGDVFANGQSVTPLDGFGRDTLDELRAENAALAERLAAAEAQNRELAERLAAVEAALAALATG